MCTGLWEVWLLDSSILCGAVPPKGLLMSYKLFNYYVSSVLKYYNYLILAIRSNCEARTNMSRRQMGAELIQHCFSPSCQHVCNPPKKTWRKHKYSWNCKISLATVHYYCDNIKLQTQTTLMVWSPHKKEKIVFWTIVAAKWKKKTF